MPECHAGDKRSASGHFSGGAAHDARNVDLLTCPGCGAAELIEAAKIDARSHLIVCGHCGESWKAASRPAESHARRHGDSKGPIPEPLDAGEPIRVRREDSGRRQGRAEAGWSRESREQGACFIDLEATKVKSSRPGKPGGGSGPRGRRPLHLLAALLSVVFLAGAVLARPAVVKAVPDLASLYALAGLAVDLDPVVFEDVAVGRVLPKPGSPLLLTGHVVSRDASPRTLSPIAVTFLGAGGSKLGHMRVQPPAQAIGAGGSLAFSYALAEAPASAKAVHLRFERIGQVADATATPASTPAEMAPVETAGNAATPGSRRREPAS